MAVTVQASSTLLPYIQILNPSNYLYLIHKSMVAACVQQYEVPWEEDLAVHAGPWLKSVQENLSHTT